MKAERWRQVDELLDATLERAPAERAAFLDSACAGDEELRREVESLLAASEQVDSFIETSPPWTQEEIFTANQPMLAAGRRLSHYEIVSPLGAGGMGEIYLAEDISLGRRVALKLLPTSLTAHPESRARFLREARLAATLDHPNICTIHEVGGAAGCHFIAMQYIEGGTLKDAIDKRPLSLKSLLSISLQVAGAMAAAHDRGIIHRDIKPGNIMITPRGQAKVLDFGLAKPVEPEASSATKRADADVTRTGMMLGTPAYMSPEQARGERVGLCSDIFSFGIVLYEMATGCLPFNGKSAPETLNAVINEVHPPTRSHNRDI